MVMRVLLTGWSGPPMAVPHRGNWDPGAGVPVVRHPSAEIDYTLRRDGGRVLLTAASPDVVVRKTVLANGDTDVRVERGRDAAQIVATQAAVTVSHRKRSVRVNVNGGHEEQLARVRALLLRSDAVRALRTLATVLDESGTETPDKMGVRLTGTLVAQLDGDGGAVRRLSRELQARHGSSSRRAPRHAPATCWDLYRAGLMKAASNLEASLECLLHVALPLPSPIMRRGSAADDEQEAGADCGGRSRHAVSAVARAERTGIRHRVRARWRRSGGAGREDSP